MPLVRLFSMISLLLTFACPLLHCEEPIDRDFLKKMSPFGIGSSHANNWGMQANARWIPQMTAIGISNTRTCATSWGAVEPDEGKWSWDALDKQMTYLDEQKIAYGGILIGNPKWNTLDKKGNLPVNNIAAWSKYVTEVVKHCKGRVRNWEIWNEPPNGTGKDQTAADYAKIVIAAYDAAKAVDPNCQIGIAAKSVEGASNMSRAPRTC